MPAWEGMLTAYVSQMAVPGTYRARRPADRSDRRTWPQNTTSMTTVSMNPVWAQLDTLETYSD
ncbi:hypothetical protein PGT21_008268 [Puccinia graminis f. sp. tritici]|uniref:Uncharacterized protein n=1 Tax=Puccinia graminis f. sp. tritici TaxID=56615 RepID=A0A5B0PCQ0_PUCGR|nr:hypothetical protein PGT21_008268 [Puccinia graminis f. sp. tritici]KAA1099081.1 hypothetical protein PGTUg99_015085 [Puccinia graminis f. sp. tritici]